MQDFDTTTENNESTNEERESSYVRFNATMKGVFKKFVLFVSFGPGILGFLWLLGKVFKPR